MKDKLFFLTLLLMGSLIFSCEKSDIDLDNEYEKSHKVWLDFKESSDNTYNYTVTGSSWTGTAWETKITVSKGIITQREFRFTSTEGLTENFPEEDLEWIEYENEINSHENTAAAESLTLDEVYAKAKNEWLIKRKNAKAYFEAKNAGLISVCGYVENGCMDDCFRGIKILYINKIQ